MSILIIYMERCMKSQLKIKNKKFILIIYFLLFFLTLISFIYVIKDVLSKQESIKENNLLNIINIDESKIVNNIDEQKIKNSKIY